MISRRVLLRHGARATFWIPASIAAARSARAASVLGAAQTEPLAPAAVSRAAPLPDSRYAPLPQSHYAPLAESHYAPLAATNSAARPAAFASPHASPGAASRAPASPPPPGPKPLVMLDPGHGGKDSGAIGYTGTYEKHVAFAAAQELSRQLAASGRYRVEMTRARDVFIPLEDRVGIAQQNGAALFVSMHADALSDPSVRGASVYTLGDTASDSQTAALAQRENSADRFAGPRFQNAPPEVAQILASLVRHETRAGSARMQRTVVGELHHEVPLLTNPARHARFMVLKAADIPSVLVEMGFMSNPEDEAQLRRADHRALVAAAMKRAVDAYFANAGVAHLTG